MRNVKVERNPNAAVDKSRRKILIGGVRLVAGASLSMAAAGAASTPSGAATSSNPGNGMDMRNTETAVVFIDPQNDVLSEKGANWGAVGASVTEKVAKANG